MLKSNLYRITTGVCVILLAVATVFVLMRWGTLPQEIPLHYNIKGEADSYGGKGALIVMMVMAWVVLLVITAAIRFPEKWNLPVKITEENRSRIYAIARAMLEAVKVIAVILFAVLLISAATAGAASQWIISLLIAALMLTVIAGIGLMYKYR